MEDGSAAAIADCDWNDVEQADFDCIASAASDESVIRDRDPTPTEPEPETTLNVCKEVTNQAGANAVPSDFIISFGSFSPDPGTASNPTPDEFRGDADCTEVTFSGPGQYIMSEEFDREGLTFVSSSASGDCIQFIGRGNIIGRISEGETQTCTITNTVSVSPNS